MKNFTFISTFLLNLLFSYTSSANPYDLFGADPLAKATAGSSALTAPLPWSATSSNPAVLADFSKVSAGFGYSYGHLGLTMNSKDANLLDYHGIDAGLAVPLGSIKHIPFTLGFTMHMPDQFLLRVQSIPSSEPRFIFYDNYPHRMITALGLAFKPVSWLSIGFGADILMDLNADNLHIFIGSNAGEKIGEMNMETSLPIHATPQAGILIKTTFLPAPLNTLKFGLFYRESYSFNVKMNIVADVDIANVVTGDTLIFLKTLDHFMPRKVAFGLSWSKKDLIDLYLGADWYNWSEFNKGFTSLKFLIDFGINPPMIDVILPDNNFKNILSPHAGFSVHAGEVTFSLGYAFRPSPVPEQTGFTTLADNDIHILGMGLAVPFSKAGNIPFIGNLLLLDYCKKMYLSYQFQYFSTKTAHKINPTLSDVTYGGNIHQFAIGFKYKF